LGQAAGNNPETPDSNAGLRGRGAKVAADAPQGSQTTTPVDDTAQKKVLASYLQQDTSYAGKIGIDSANAASAMPAATADHATPIPGVELSGTLQGTATAALPTAGAAHDPSTAARAAQAVETVISLVDAQASRAQGSASAVKLNFNFNGDDLAVRIEMSNGVVHTQFRTDSAELRGAIASEWQASSPAPQNRAMIFTAPSFSGSGGQSDAALTSDGGASRRQEPGSPDTQTGTWPHAGHARSQTQESRVPPATASIPTVRHLQTFA
jgi:hypothetical protein